LGWQGTERQWARLEKAISVMAVIIMPLAVSVHTVVSWVFAMTLKPMWHSTIFGPYFVVGAIYSGIAAVIIAMWALRRALKLQTYLRPIHFNNLGLLLVTFSLLWSYFTFAEYLTTWYGGVPEEMAVFQAKLFGPLAPYFWTMVVFCVALPLPLMAFKRTRTVDGTFVASVSVIIGMWLERYVIVVGTLNYPALPFVWGRYSPTWVEISLTLGAFAYFAFLYLLFSKFFPIIAIWEYRAGRERQAAASGAAAAELAPAD
ncbi:MAG: NrfD/PsrC family molybdoenzyme membrane anchor subunit, partial [Acidobacteriota bacterium]